MDGPLTLVTTTVGLPWSERRGPATGEDRSAVLSTGSRWRNPVPTVQMGNIPLSPISTGQEVTGVVLDSNTAVPPALQSATSSDATWNTAYQGDGQVESPDEDMNWGHGAVDERLAVPKVEPVEDESFCMNDVQEAPRTSDARDRLSSNQPKTKRPRGRPRKYPLPPQVVNNKIAKGRSKTGCITCRKRKKKCDEAKPRCLNCEKNAVVCEGYHEKTLWKSGREKAEELQRQQSLPQITLQPIFQGVETSEDRIFFGHYINKLSSVLTVEGQHKNAFRDMLLQMAVEHHGLMHSILSLASKHIDYDTPYGSKLLSSDPNVTFSSLTSRSQFHHNAAMKQLLAWGSKDEGAPEQKANLAPRYGQMLCLMLQTAAEGTPDGAHRVHLQAYKTLISENPPPNKAFTTFITEFFQYRVFADELIRYPDMQTKRLATEDWVPWTDIEPARLIGIGDKLFHQLAKITTIRNEIRANMLAHVEPVVDSASLFRAAEIDVAIREWAPTWPVGDDRDRVSLLYKQMMWVYLFRTIYCPWTSSPSPLPPLTTSEMLAASANMGFGHHHSINSSIGMSMGGDGGHGHSHNHSHSHSHGHSHGHSHSHSLNHRMPLSPASSQPCSTTLSPPPSGTLPPIISDRRLSSGSHHSISSYHTTHLDTPSPPPTITPTITPTTTTATITTSPTTTAGTSTSTTSTGTTTSSTNTNTNPNPNTTVRYPPNYNQRISLAVNESLAILSSFQPNDAVQTLLLVPCLVVGCASFAPQQQERVRAAVRVVRAYTGLRNCDRVAEVLEEVWRLMARAEWARVWDWQGVARSMGLDFACA